MPDATTLRQGTWHPADCPPDGTKGKWSRQVIVVTCAGDCFRLAYLHYESITFGQWQRPTAMQPGDKPLYWTEVPTDATAPQSAPTSYTTDKPTVPGWYWVRCHKRTGKALYTDWHAVRFTMHEHGLDAANGVLSINSCVHFSGPIPEPTENPHPPKAMPTTTPALKCAHCGKLHFEDSRYIIVTATVQEHQMKNDGVQSEPESVQVKDAVVCDNVCLGNLLALKGF